MCNYLGKGGKYIRLEIILKEVDFDEIGSYFLIYCVVLVIIYVRK